jgi:hypothetical protein
VEFGLSVPQFEASNSRAPLDGHTPNSPSRDIAFISCQHENVEIDVTFRLDEFMAQNLLVW